MVCRYIELQAPLKQAKTSRAGRQHKRQSCHIENEVSKKRKKKKERKKEIGAPFRRRKALLTIHDATWPPLLLALQLLVTKFLRGNPIMHG